MIVTSWRINLLLLTFACCIAGCERPQTAGPATVHEDGLYRGVFIDKADIQVNVEFMLRNGVVTEASFRHLRRDDNYHLETEAAPYRYVIQQYQDALQHLVGKDIETHLKDLYHPEHIVTTEVDGYTAATLRSNKILSAIRDALNRGVYSYGHGEGG